jgi:hypothetical protein
VSSEPTLTLLQAVTYLVYLLSLLSDKTLLFLKRTLVRGLTERLLHAPTLPESLTPENLVAPLVQVQCSAAYVDPRIRRMRRIATLI